MKNVKLKKLLTLITATFITAAVMLPINASAAWNQDSNGWWNTEGSSYSTGWRSIDNKWYYFGSDGYMKTGWINDAGKWYYTASSGAMQTGWLSDNGVWYYLSTSGDMKTGLVDVNNKTYYLNESGAMRTGNVTVNGINYTFAASGEKVNSTESNTTTSNTNTTNSTTSSTSSGGSGGGSSSSSDSTTTSSHPYYESLIGTWNIKSHIPSTIHTDYKDLILSLCIGKEVVIESNKISVADGYKTITNPTITEGTLTSSEFSNKYDDTFANLGISGNSVKSIHISSGSNYVDIFVTDDDTVYTLVKGALFELEK